MWLCLQSYRNFKSGPSLLNIPYIESDCYNVLVMFTVAISVATDKWCHILFVSTRDFTVGVAHISLVLANGFILVPTVMLRWFWSMILLVVVGLCFHILNIFHIGWVV